MGPAETDGPRLVSHSSLPSRASKATNWPSRPPPNRTFDAVGHVRLLAEALCSTALTIILLYFKINLWHVPMIKTPGLPVPPHPTAPHQRPMPCGTICRAPKDRVPIQVSARQAHNYCSAHMKAALLSASVQQEHDQQAARTKGDK